MFWTVVLEQTFKSPFNCKEIKAVNRKGNQSWIFIGRTDAEAEAPILWPPDAKNWLIGKDPDAGKDWRQEEKGMTEDEVVEWHHRLDGHEFEQALGAGDGQVLQSMGSQRVGDDWETELNWTERGNQLKVGSAFKAGGFRVSPLELFLSSCRLLSLCGGWWQQGQVKMLMESEEESRKSWEKEAKKDGCVFPQRTAESDLWAAGRESRGE